MREVYMSLAWQRHVTVMDWLFVSPTPPKCMSWILNPQCNCTWKWNLLEVIRFRRAHKGGASMISILFKTYVPAFNVSIESNLPTLCIFTHTQTHYFFLHFFFLYVQEVIMTHWFFHCPKTVKVRHHYQSHASGATLSFHFIPLNTVCLSLVGQVDCLRSKMS